MTDDRVLELVSAAADVELNANDQAEMDRLLESSPGAREFKADLVKMDSLFSEIPDLDPPASLHAQIVAHIEPRPSQQRASVPAWLHDMRLGAGLRYAMAASAGALLVVIFFAGGQSTSGIADFSELVGTIAPNTTSTDIIDTFTFRDDGFESQVQLERSNGVLFLNVEIDAAAPLDISVDMAGAGFQANAIAQNEGNFDSIVLADQAVKMRAVGHQRLTIFLRRVDDTTFAGEAKITLEFSSDGKVLQQGALIPAL